MIQLEAKDGTLYYPANVVDAYGDPSPIVLCVYDAGDCDTIKWPKPNSANLRRALFDGREQGYLDGPSVLLPNGKEFSIDR